MMPEQFAAFIILSLVFITIPGPNILVIVATSLGNGRKRGLQTVAGTSLAMIVQLVVAALATSSLLNLLNEGLVWLKWMGVCYLLYLAVKSLYRCWQPTADDSVSAAGSFQRGFLVSLTNPKTIFFFSAFLPQFVSSSEHYLLQISLLSSCFWLLAVICDSAYAVLASELKWLVGARQFRVARVQNGLTGTLYLAASGMLAFSHKT